MTEIVDFAEARKQKKEKDFQESLKKLPPVYVQYIQARDLQIAAMKKLMFEIAYFEREILTFSKNRKIPGPLIDTYLLNKESLEYAIEILRVSDAQIKEKYPFAELSPISL